MPLREVLRCREIYNRLLNALRLVLQEIEGICTSSRFSDIILYANLILGVSSAAILISLIWYKRQSSITPLVTVLPHLYLPILKYDTTNLFNSKVTRVRLKLDSLRRSISSLIKAQKSIRVSKKMYKRF